MEGRAEVRLGYVGRTGSGDPPLVLHNTSAAWWGFFCFNTVYTSHLHFVLQLLFFPMKVGCLSCPMRDCLLIAWFWFFSNLHDLQLWRGFQSCDLQYSVSWRKSSLLCHHFHQRTWRSWYWKGLFLHLRYSLVFGEYCLPVFLSPEFEKALSVCFQKAF